MALIGIDQRNNHLNPVRSLLSMAVYPVQYAVSLPVRFGHNFLDSAVRYNSLVEENMRLQREHLVYQSRLLKLAALEKENFELRRLLDSSYELGEQVLISELLNVNLDPYKHSVLVNKGSHFDVFEGQPVIDANGVVGQVYRVNPLNSEIVLISDPSHSIPVEIVRNGLRTIVVGNGRINELSLPFLPNNADIRPGDKAVTSGLGGIFPQGYPVATITGVEPQTDQPFARVTAEPAAHLDRSRELLLVWSHKEPILFFPEKNKESDEKSTENEAQ